MCLDTYTTVTTMASCIQRHALLQTSLPRYHQAIHDSVPLFKILDIVVGQP